MVSIVACSHEGCEAPVAIKSRRLCRKHYNQWYLHTRVGNALPGTPRACDLCGTEFVGGSSAARYCSRRCVEKAKPSANNGTCVVCGETMQANGTSAPPERRAHRKCRSKLPPSSLLLTHGQSGYERGCRCNTCRDAKAEANRRFKERYRAKNGESPGNAWRRRYRDEHGVWPQRTGGDAFISHPARVKLYERDKWTCQICGNAVDPTAHYNADRYPTLDHIIPQSAVLVPDHSPSNLRTACRLCNATRGAALI